MVTVMQTTTELQKLVESEYGVGIVVAPVVAILWAAMTINEKYCREVAIEQLSAVNTIRSKYGVPFVYADF